MDPTPSPFPLQGVTTEQLQELCCTLWDWKRCDLCLGQLACEDDTCPWPRFPRMTPFFSFYKSVTASYVPDFMSSVRPALQTHHDVFRIIRFLKSRPDTPRQLLTEEYFRNGYYEEPPEVDQERAFNVVVRIMIMMNCSADNQNRDHLELGFPSTPWRQNMSLSGFLSTTFAIVEQPGTKEADQAIDSSRFTGVLKAKNLRKVAGLRFEATDDLRDHLRLDREEGVVKLFHHTAFLKEHLISSRLSPQPMTLSASITSGNIPRQLALEVVDSLQKLLFPSDPESQALLRSLVAKNGLDSDCLRFDSSAYRLEGENNIGYVYFASRLMDLCEEMENPAPRGLLEKWMERKSGARYVMMATLAGVAIAVVLGILSLAVGIFQAWVAYEQWKNP